MGRKKLWDRNSSLQLLIQLHHKKSKLSSKKWTPSTILGTCHRPICIVPKPPWVRSILGGLFWPGNWFGAETFGRCSEDALWQCPGWLLRPKVCQYGKIFDEIVRVSSVHRFGLFQCIQKAELLRGVLLFWSYRRCVDQRRDVQCFREMQNVSRPTKG